MPEEITKLREHHQALEKMLKGTPADDVQARLRIITVLVKIELGLLAHKPRRTKAEKEAEKEAREQPFGGRVSNLTAQEPQADADVSVETNCSALVDPFA